MEKVAIVKYDGTLNALRRVVELCDGFEKLKTSDKVLLKPNILLGDCAISANSDLQDAAKIKGCPPPILDTVMTIMRNTLPKKKFRKILMSRLIKNIGIKLKIYDEAFPAFGYHKPPEFDRSHF